MSIRTLVPFDQEWSNLTWWSTLWKACLYWFSHVPVSMGSAQRSQLSHIVSPRTEFGIVTHRKGYIYRINHAIAFCTNALHCLSVTTELLVQLLGKWKWSTPKTMKIYPHLLFLKYCRSPFYQTHCMLCYFKSSYSHIVVQSLCFLSFTVLEIWTVCSKDVYICFWFKIWMERWFDNKSVIILLGSTPERWA